MWRAQRDGWRKPLVLATTVLIVHSLGAAAPAAKEIHARHCTSPPAIDGKLDDACWQDAAVLKDFVLLKTHKPASQQTEVRLCADGHAIYIAFSCLESDMRRLKVTELKRDGEVYADDAVEVFLSAASEGTEYYHFVVNAAGTQRDDVGANPGWNARWSAAAQRGQDRWTVEIAIPFDQIPIPPETTGVFLVNFARHETPHEELSSWFPCGEGFHEPKNFAELKGITADLVPQVRAYVSRQLAKVTAQYTEAVSAVSPPREGSGSWFEADFRTHASQLGDRLASINTDIQGSTTLAAIKAVSLRLKEAERSVTALLAASRRLQMLSQAPPAYGPSPDMLLCAESTMTKIRGDRPYSGRPVAETGIVLARNEYEAAQIVIVPVAKPLKNVRVRLGPLRAEQGDSFIPTENIRLDKVGYVITQRPSVGARGPAGKLPDPLIPFSAFDVAETEAQPIWITVYAPPGQPAGNYAGDVQFTADGCSPVSLRLKVWVLDFDLPRTSALRTCFLLNPGFVAQRHKLPGPWTWACNEEHYRRDPEALTVTDTTAAQGKRSLTGRRSASQYVHIYVPGAYTNKNTRLSFAYRFDDPGTFYIMFSPGKNYSIAPKGQTPGVWHRCDISLEETRAPAGATGGLSFYHDNNKTGRDHSFFIDDIVIYEPQPGGGKKVIFAEDFEKGLSTDRLDDLVRAYRLNMLAHRCSDANVASPEVKISEDGTVTMDWTKFDAEIQFYLDRGLNGFNLPWLRIGSGWGQVKTPNTERDLKIARQILEQTESHLEQKGWLKYAYIYTIDEPGAKAFDNVKKAFGLAHQYAPRLKRLLTYGYGATRPWKPGATDVKPAYAQLLDFVDIHVPHIDCFDPVTMEIARAMPNREVWEYICISAKHPYPNMWAIDYPGLENRVCYWQLWRYNITGFLYWAVTYWKEDVWKNPMSYPGGNGDGSLLYWGTKEMGLPERIADCPINSIRWELTRDGIEDYDYLALLADLAKKAEGVSSARALANEARKLLDVTDVTRSFTEYTSDPAVLEQHRLAVGEHIERLARCLSEATR